MDTNREPSESKQTAKASQDQRELLRITLSSIGDAVITTETSRTAGDLAQAASFEKISYRSCTLDER